MADDTTLIALTVDIVSSYVEKNSLRAEDVPALIASTHAAVRALGTADGASSSEAPPEFAPAVSARKSLASPDHIISLIDGKPYKTLRRHLTTHGLTPEGYRQRYGLKTDYPMVAPSYSETRKALARKSGLGRKPTAADDAPASDSAKRATLGAFKKSETEALETTEG